MAGTDALGVLDKVRPRGRARRRWILGVIALLIVLGLGFGYRAMTAKQAPAGANFVTVPVERGDLRETVTATGTLNPVDSVEVGAEVTGRVVRVNFDINDHVKEGDVLAEIDPETLQARVDQSKAGMTSASAAAASARATLNDADVKVKRARDLFAKGLLSSQDLETAEATYTKAKAGMSTASAQQVSARADFKTSNTQLSKAIIRSPISGIVLDRTVQQGQTVTAGFQTPVLFTLARDLTKLELDVDVDEADVGGVKEGQEASFEVDAYPDKAFPAKLVKLHSMPKTGTNVVTYTAELSVDNDERLLRPGMTATASIVTSERKGVLLVPNAALRFEPPRTGTRGGPPMGFLPFMGGRRTSSKPAGSAAPKIDPNAPTVYILKDGRPRRVEVKTGATDGTKTEVSASALEPGAMVITDVKDSEEAP